MPDSFHFLNDRKRALCRVLIYYFQASRNLPQILVQVIYRLNILNLICSVSYLTMSPRKDLIERGPWWTFFSTVTKVNLGDNLSQFESGKISKFVPYSKYPPYIKDVSF